MAELAIRRTDELSPRAQERIRALLHAAFDGHFSDDDWEHALGGWHALLEEEQGLVAHASLVPRRLFVGDRPFAAGYVEAVAVDPRRQRQGLGLEVMAPVNALIRTHFELGALSTGEWAFYERLGWERWRGPTWVRGAGGALARTAEEDDGVMVLRTGASAAIDLTAAITCEERAGDSW